MSGIRPGDLLRDRHGEVWRVIGYIDRPAVIVRSLEVKSPHDETHVIDSPLFREKFPIRLIPAVNE